MKFKEIIEDYLVTYKKTSLNDVFFMLLLDF